MRWHFASLGAWMVSAGCTLAPTAGPEAQPVSHGGAPAAADPHTASGAPGRASASPQKATALLRARLAQHREQQLARLHAYAQAGVFPRNERSPGYVHMFRDDGGRLCAVANLVHADGRDDLVDDVAAHHNDLQIAHVHDGPLYDWLLASGLSQEELARIQVPLPPRMRPKPLAVAAGKPTRAAGPAAIVRSEDDVRTEIQGKLAEVEADLRAGSERSLDLALARWVDARPGPAAVAALSGANTDVDVR
jgi:hypothetical protein